jgi:hypothetical protein
LLMLAKHSNTELHFQQGLLFLHYFLDGNCQ